LPVIGEKKRQSHQWFLRFCQPFYAISFCETLCTNAVELSAMLVPHEKIIGQFHLVYHIHARDEVVAMMVRYAK
jgi:hypothetical protein